SYERRKGRWLLKALGAATGKTAEQIEEEWEVEFKEMDSSSEDEFSEEEEEEEEGSSSSHMGVSGEGSAIREEPDELVEFFIQSMPPPNSARASPRDSTPVT